MANTISIEVLSQTQKATRGLDQVKGQLTGFGNQAQKASGRASGFGKALTAGLAGGAIVGGISAAVEGIKSLAGAVSDSVAEARESQKVNATTAQIIKATGGAAKLSASQVGDLSTAISNKTGVDDEQIQKGANLLLTFKKVQDQAGKGGKVFSRATAAAADLSAAGFGSIESSSKMLGKALNDPVKGITALSRAGVTFTDQQKKQITALTKSGDLLGAQKIILGEVEGQVGGVAAKSSTAGEKMATFAANLKEQFGTILLPYIDRFANFFTTKIGPAISKGIALVAPILSKVASAVGPIISKLASGFAKLTGSGGPGGLAAKLAPLGRTLGGIFGAVGGVIRTVLPILLQVGRTLISAFVANLPAIQGAGNSIKSIITSIGSIITTVWSKIGPVVLPIIKSVFGAIVAIIGGALKIISGVFKVISSVLKGDWKGAWDGIKQIASGAVQIVLGIVRNIMNQAKAIIAPFSGVILKIATAVRSGLSRARDTAKSILSAIKLGFTTTWSAIVGAVSGAINRVASFVASKVNAARSAVSSANNAIKSAFSSAWRAVVTAVTTAISSVVSKAQAIKGKVTGALAGAASWLYSAGKNVVQGLINGISGALGFVASKAREIATTAINAAKNALGIASPSKQFIKIGRFVTQGLAVGMTGSLAQVTATSKKLSDLVIDTFSDRTTAKVKANQAKINKLRKGGTTRAEAARIRALQRSSTRAEQINKRAMARYLKITTTATNKLKANAVKREAVAKQLSAANSKLADMVKVRNDYAASIRDAARSYANITQITAGENETLSASTLVQGLRDRLNAIVNFNTKLAKLKSLKINKTTYDQIAQAGVEGGTADLNALVAGGAAAVKQVNLYQGQIDAATTSLGNTTADTMYRAGILAQQGFIRGLEKDQKALEKSAAKIAATLTKAIKKALGIRSPSRVFAEIGDNVTKGLVVGLDTTSVKSSARSMAVDLVQGFGTPQLAAQAGRGGVLAGSTVNINITVPVGATKAEVGREVVEAIKAYERTGGRR